MTARSLVIGLLAALFIGGICYFNDLVIAQKMLVPHQLPPVVYGSLVVFLLLLNPLLGRISPAAILSGKELAVIATLGLIACGIASWGLVQGVAPNMILPHHHVRLQPEWKRARVIETIPDYMLVDLGDRPDVVLDGYVGALSEGKKHIAWSRIPWQAWRRPLAFWLPFVLAVTLATFGLAALFHEQWAHHEQLPYPITVFARSLLPEPGQARSVVFRNRLFWIGFLGVLVALTNNYLHKWRPDVVIPVTMRLDMTALKKVLPFFGGYLLSMPIVFAAIGFAYFLPSNVSLSVGIVPYLHSIVVAVLTAYGVSLAGGGHLGQNPTTYLFAGGYLGLFLLLLFTGRHFYWNALKRGLGFPTRGDTTTPRRATVTAVAVGAFTLCALLFVLRAAAWIAVPGAALAALLHYRYSPGRAVRDRLKPHSVWGMRVFLLSSLVFLAMLVFAGLDWPLALAWGGIALVTFTVVSRIVAETGAFQYGTYFLPGAVILGFTGASAVAPREVLIMSLAAGALLLAPGWAPMPFFMQGLCLADRAKVNIGRTARAGVLALLICVPVALAVTIYWHYDRGAPLGNWPAYATRYPPRDGAESVRTLESRGELQEVEARRGWNRVAHIRPDTRLLTMFFVTVAIAVGVGLCHLRFTWWPFHPVMFVFLGSPHGQLIAFSLLLGCLVKTLVSKYGGARLYGRLKPLMIGVIAGDVVAQLIPTVVGPLYYMATGLPPPA